MTGDLLLQFSQFGMAGLVGLLWLLERRHAATRERQLDEAHRRLIEHRRESDVLLNVVRENTRAIVALESSQRVLVDLCRGWMTGRESSFRNHRHTRGKHPVSS